MISKVKGKAEVSLYLAGLLPVATRDCVTKRNLGFGFREAPSHFPSAFHGYAMPSILALSFSSIGSSSVR